MKKTLKITAALILLALFAAACNNYVCPAYSYDGVEGSVAKEVRS